MLACEIAIARAGLEGEGIITTALAHLRRGEQGSPALCRQLKLLASQLDDAYLDLFEACDETNTPEVSRLFNKARAAFALDIALVEGPEQLDEAIYEAISAADESARIIGPMTEALHD